MNDRDMVLQSIRKNISDHGYHLYVVSGTPVPRYAYTIGISEWKGVELIFAGGMIYMASDLEEIFASAIVALRHSKENEKVYFRVGSLGAFNLQAVDETWAKPLALGVFDFYGRNDICLLQIVPDSEHTTIDVPNMSVEWNSSMVAAWQWIYDSWDYPIPSSSTAVTNVAALRGENVTEAARWGMDEWELFAGPGPDVPREDVRVVPIAVLLASDASMFPIIDLGVGKALWRDPVELEWHPWEAESSVSS